MIGVKPRNKDRDKWVKRPCSHVLPTELHKMLLHPFSKMIILISVMKKKSAHFSAILILFNEEKNCFWGGKEYFSDILRRSQDSLT